MGFHKVVGLNEIPAVKNGDDFLSSNEFRYWELCYSTLYKFGCPTMFNVFGPAVPQKLDQQITFFVPRSHPLCHKVIEYLKYELDRDVRPSSEVSGEWFWGTSYEVLEFEGPSAYIDRDTSERAAHQFVEQIRNMFSVKENKN